MEEKRLNRRFSDLLDETAHIIEGARKGFFGEKASVIKENRARFREILRDRAASAEEILREKKKSDEELKFANMIIPFQTVASAIENLMEKMEIKVEARILFSEKALKEIKALCGTVESQLMDTKDYILTRNPNLKALVQKSMEEVKKMADEYALIHETRLITGVCMPKASYLYIDITDSIKRIARGLVEFTEKV